MKHRALTLIELLVCLALLGLLSMALTSWVQMTVRASAQAGSTLPWETAAQATLQRIAEDLLIGNFALAKKLKTPAKADDQRVQILDGQLVIHTRCESIGVCKHIYELTPGSSQMTLAQRTGTESIAADVRMLLGDVAAWSCQIDAKDKRLDVSLTSMQGMTIGRSFRWF